MAPNPEGVEEFDDSLDTLLREFSEKLPHFPDGRIDYTLAQASPVVDCFVRCGEKLLILERSDKVGFLKNSWNMISGFLDEPGKSLQEKAYEEVEEETGISRKDIIRYIWGAPYRRFNKSIDRTWYVFPVLADIEGMLPVRLDWEHTNFAWVKPSELSNYDPTARIEFVLSRILDL
jgi:8-oxo-dGTP pyrophosphatase MutT (NUDIX family)